MFGSHICAEQRTIETASSLKLATCTFYHHSLKRRTLKVWQMSR